MWCTFILCCTKFSQWLLPSQASLLLKVEILCHQTVHLCSHSVLHNAQFTLTSHKTESNEFCWQTFTIINDSKNLEWRWPSYCLSVLCDPWSRWQPGRQRRSWPQTDHSQRHQHKACFYINSSAGPCSSLGISFGHPVPASRMVRVQWCLSGPSLPESSLLGSVTASGLVLSRDHNRRLEHSQGYSWESRLCFTGWVTLIARLLAPSDLLTASLRKFFLLEWKVLMSSYFCPEGKSPLSIHGLIFSLHRLSVNKDTQSWNCMYTHTYTWQWHICS